MPVDTMMLQPQTKEEESAKIGHQRTPTAEDFPLPAKQLLSTSSASNRKDAAAITPAKSSFTFSDIEEQMPGYAKSRPSSRQAASRPGSSHQCPGPRVNSRVDPTELPKKASVDGLRRQETGGRKLSNASNIDPNQRSETPRSRSAMSILPFREVSHGAREKVHRDSVILAEVKTNIIIRDEFLFLKEFSTHLSSRYQKPLSSVFVTLDHSACLLFANSFDSAYILTITALPSQIVASANKRNAALIQSFMTSALGVLPDRGIVKFVGLGDDYIATAGTTIQGQAERLERVLSLDQDEQRSKPPDIPLPQTPPVVVKHGPIPPPPRTASNPKKKPPALSLLPKSRSMPGSKMPSPIAVDSPSALPQIPIPPRSKTPSIFDRKAERMRGAGRRKSILALLTGRGGPPS